MTNPYDKFDQSGGNPYDQFDTPKPERGNVFQRTADWLTAGVTGSRTDPSIPRSPLTADLNLPASQAAKMTALLATTASDDRLQSGIKRIIPEAQFDRDEYGNLVAIVPYGGSTEAGQGRWTRFYPNPSGLGVTDVMQASGALALGQGLTSGAAKLLGPKALGWLGMSGVGATEAGLIEAISSKLSGNRFQALDIPLGAAGGAIGAGLGQVIDNLVSSRATVLDSSGALTPQVRQMLRNAGVDPDDFGPDFARRFADDIQRRIDPAQARSIAEAETLPTPVQLTQGQSTGNRVQQVLEGEAAKGVYGQTARDITESTFRRQQEQLAANIPGIQQKIAGASGAIDVRQGGAQAQEALVAQRETARKTATDLFTRAREAGDAFLDTGLAKQNADDLFSAVDSFAPEAAPTTYSILKTVADELGERGSISRLFQLRSQLSNAGQAGSPDQAAGQAAARKLDDMIYRAVDDALLDGNPEVATLYADAVRNYRDFAQRWKSGGILDRLTQGRVRDGSFQLDVAPEDAANYIFGRTSNQMINKTNLNRDLATLRENLPPEQWNALRQEAFIKLFDKAQRSGTGDVTGVTFSRAWKDMQRNNPELVGQLFTDAERGLISQFAAVATRIGTTATNTSNSTTAMGAVLPRLLQAFGGTGIGRLSLAFPVLGPVLRAAQTARVAGAMRARPERLAGPLIGSVAGGGSAAASNQDVQNMVTGRNIGPR